MYVCVCTGITDHHIAEAVGDGAASLCDLKARLGLGACCGRCAEFAQFILDEQIASAGGSYSLELSSCPRGGGAP